MEYEKIKQLMEDMGNSKLSSISIEFPDGTKINMEKDVVKKQKVVVEQENDDTTEVEEATEEVMEKVQESNDNVKIITSPMVGTFYSKPSPTADVYVDVGSQIEVGDTLCIIEAMKLMNEIESEFTGKITKVLIQDGQSVEYGTPLFEIEL